MELKTLKQWFVRSAFVAGLVAGSGQVHAADAPAPIKPAPIKIGEINSYTGPA